MSETIKLDDLRLFAAVAESGSFTGAALGLALPKQTVSRRIAELEARLGVRLLHRTTRRVSLTDAGHAYALRCAELVRMANEATEAVTSAGNALRGVLRVTADPLFGESFLAPIVSEYLERYADVRVDLVLVQRKVDLIEEGIDVAFRVGETPSDGSLIARRLGPAAMIYCASPAYLARRGKPSTPEELTVHDLIVLAPEGGPTRWLLDGVWLRVEGRVRLNHLPTARQLALDGVGIAALPAFACSEDVRAGRLCAVLEPSTQPFGNVQLLYPTSRLLAPRVRCFIDLVLERLDRGTLSSLSINRVS